MRSPWEGSEKKNVFRSKLLRHFDAKDCKNVFSPSNTWAGRREQGREIGMWSDVSVAEEKKAQSVLH